MSSIRHIRKQCIAFASLYLFLLFGATYGFSIQCCYCRKTTSTTLHRFSNTHQQRQTTRIASHAAITEDDNNDHSSSVSSPSSSSSRRNFLTQVACTGAAAVSSFVSTAAVVHAADNHSNNVSPSLLSSIQGPIQDLIAPGHWIGQFLGLNSKTVTWGFTNNQQHITPSDIVSATVDVWNSLGVEKRSQLCIPYYQITKANEQSGRVHIQTWTKNEWLDSFDLTVLKPTTNDSKTTTVKASFYATGFLPTSIPGAPLINIGFFFFPFASPGPRGTMLQEFRLNTLENMIRQKVNERTQTPRMTGL